MLNKGKNETMKNIEQLKSYLIDYLLKNNQKIVMLSGAWGSGKTYFWHESKSKDSIEYHLNQSNKPNIYISLYGKTSLKSIENEIFIKAYNRSLNKKNDNLDMIEKISSTFSSSSVINLVEQVTNFKIKNIINLMNETNIFFKTKKSKRFMSNLIICFDDFERKSKDVDLNDLFGFITNLYLQYEATVVIILNDDVFNAKDKKIFYNLKEKSVNKFLKFNPSDEELFKIIFGLYNINNKYKNILLSSIKEMNIINARVYKNIFENFEEFNTKYENLTDEEVRFFVLSMITFNLTHKVFKFYDYPENLKNWNLPLYFLTLDNVPTKMITSLIQMLKQKNQNQCFSININLMSSIKSWIVSDYKTVEEPNKKVERKATEGLAEDLRTVDKYADDIWSFWKLESILKYRENVSETMQRTINSFIEDGILYEVSQ